MSPSPSLGPRPVAVTLRTLHQQIRPQRGRSDNGSGRASHHLAETGNSPWPAHVRILSEYKRASCLKPASNCLRRPHCAKKHASVPLLQCWPKSCTGSPRQELGVSNKMESRLGIDLSIDDAVAAPEVDCLHPSGRTEDALACQRSCHRKPVFRRWPAYLHLHAAILRWRAMSVEFGDRQPCPRRSRHSSYGGARYARGRGTACWRTATSIDPQCRHSATGPYLADVFDGVSRKRDETVPAQSARPDPAPAKTFSRAEGDPGIDRQRDLIGTLPRTRFPAPPMPLASRQTVACSL